MCRVIKQNGDRKLRSPFLTSLAGLAQTRPALCLLDYWTVFACTFELLLSVPELV
jgi:hypothetical protein